MQDYEWVSKTPLRAELVHRCAAGFGVFFAIACILLASGYGLISGIFLLVAIGVTIYVIRKTPPTRIRVEGNNLYYGSSMHAGLDKLKEVRVLRQFWVEEVIALPGSEPRETIPTNGIPEDIKSELISVLKERIKC